MPRQVDVLLSPEELAQLSKQSTSCLRLDPSLLAPAMCVSKAGHSSAAMFGKHGQRPSSSKAKDVAHYARLFQKYYGSGSFVDQLVASDQAERAAAIDAEIQKRAVRETRAKYLSARLAGMYGVQVPGVIGPPPASAPQLGLTMVHATGTAHGASQQPDANSQKVLEMAVQLAAAQAAHEAAVEDEATRIAQAARLKAATRHARVKSASPAFRATSREQACTTGSKFVEAGACSPGPGKYDAYRWAKDTLPTHSLAPPKYGEEIKAQLARRAQDQEHQQAWADQQHGGGLQAEGSRASMMTAATGHTTATRAAHMRSRCVSMAGSTRGEAAGAGGAGAGAGPATAGGGIQHQVSAWTVAPQRMRPSTAPATRAGGRGGGGGAGGRQGQGVGGLAGAAGLALFSQAHHVHPRPASATGTSSFKAVPRPAPQPDTPASHLALKYHTDDIHRSQVKARHLVLPFSQQVARPPLTTGSDTPAGLGPGSYLGQSNLPTSMTGQHVHAGHAVAPRPDMARQSPRPASAPRPHGSKHGGGGGIPPVTAPQAAQALQELFGGHVSPSDYISVAQLHDLSGVEHSYQMEVAKGGGGGHSRPLSAAACARRQAAAIGAPHHQRPRPWSATLAPHIATTSTTSMPGSTHVHDCQAQGGGEPGQVAIQHSGAATQCVVAHTAGRALGDCEAGAGHKGTAAAAVAGGVGGGGGVLGLDQLHKYSSTGLNKPVPGGSFARTTRAQEIQGLRVVADGKVIPPASAPLSKIRPSQAADVVYDPVDDRVQGHHPRSPAWQLPPNRAALSKQWVSAAALAYL